MTGNNKDKVTTQENTKNTTLEKSSNSKTSQSTKKQANQKEIKENTNVNRNCIKYAREFKEQYLAHSLEFLLTSIKWIEECPEDANAKYAFIISQITTVEKREIDYKMFIRLNALFHLAESEQPGDKFSYEFFRNEAKSMIDTI